MLGKNEYPFLESSQNSEKTPLITEGKNSSSFTSSTAPVTSASTEERDLEAFPSDLQFLQETLSVGTTAIYIWNSKNQGGEGVGHIALAFNHSGEEIYVSYWPKVEIKKTLTEVEGAWHTRSDDINTEDRPPEYIKRLTTLNTRVMLEEFKNVKKITKKWSLLSSTPLKNKSLISRNCISVAVHLLKVGGLEDIAEEEIIKTKADSLDKGVLPYRRKAIDKAAKKFFSDCHSTIKGFLFGLCIIPLIIGGLFVILVRSQNRKNFLNEIPLGVQLLLVIFGILFLLIIGISWMAGRKGVFSAFVENATSLASDIARVAEVLECPYDSIRGLIEYTLMPDSRIKEIVDKAARHEAGCYEEDIAKCDEMIEANPRNIEAFQKRALLKRKIGRHEEATADYSQILKLNPPKVSTRARTYHDRGLVKYEMKDYKEAIVDYTFAIRAKPRYAAAFFNRGNAKFNLGHYQEAMVDYDKVIELRSTYMEVFYYRGQAKYESKDYKGAVIDFDHALQLNLDAEIAAEISHLRQLAILQIMQSSTFKEKSYAEFIQQKISPGETFVYIWQHPRKSAKNIEHIALSFNYRNKEFYVSYWPNKIIKKNSKKKAIAWHTRLEDLTQKKRPPEYIQLFSTLNTETMATEFQTIREMLENWDLLAGANPEIHLYRTINYISVIISLLKAGEIKKLVKEELLKLENHKKWEEEIEAKKIIGNRATNLKVKNNSSLFCNGLLFILLSGGFIGFVATLMIITNEGILPITVPLPIGLILGVLGICVAPCLSTISLYILILRICEIKSRSKNERTNKSKIKEKTLGKLNAELSYNLIKDLSKYTFISHKEVQHLLNKAAEKERKEMEKKEIWPEFVDEETNKEKIIFQHGGSSRSAFSPSIPSLKELCFHSFWQQGEKSLLKPLSQISSHLKAPIEDLQEEYLTYLSYQNG